ncbi:MAG: DNA repair protein RadC [Bacteroidales bacterium]|nr:DNA repair protein RadC [Bacteroidales bacterium]
MRLKDLPAAERPREKMLELGPGGLSNGELLAILLRIGAKGETALDQARRLLAAAGGTLSGLFALSGKGATAFKGIGPYKAASVMAALELGRRFLAEKPAFERMPLSCGRAVAEYMLPRLKGIDHEELWIIYLNIGNLPLDCEKMTSGGWSSTSLDVKQIARAALERGASSLILVHNHPSGDPNPSRADISGTNSLRRALSAFTLQLLDHVVISDGSFYSFEEGVVRDFSPGADARQDDRERALSV